MANSTRSRPQQATHVQTWVDTFPKQMVSEQESVRFVKKLLAVAVSNISFLRAIFPERAFGDRCVDELKLKILKNDTSCQGAAQIIEWLKGVFEAVDKKYLRVMTMGIFKNQDDPNTLIEAYTFRFSYKDSTSMEIYRDTRRIAGTVSTDETKKATIGMLHTLLVLMQTLKPLPNKFNVTMKLLYYDDVTPADYEPPGFKAGESEMFSFEDETMKIKIGDVATSFHTVRMRLTTDASQFQDAAAAEPCALGARPPQEDCQPIAAGLDHDEEEVSSKREGTKQQSKVVELIGTGNAFAGSSEDGKRAENDVGNGMPNLSRVEPMPAGANVEMRPANDEEEEETLGVKCPCGGTEDEGLMLRCAACLRWQHAICFNITLVQAAPACHVCHHCAVKDASLTPTDPSLVGLSAYALQKLCLWRRVLMACVETDAPVIELTMLEMKDLLGVNKTQVKMLMARLDAEGYLLPLTGRCASNDLNQVRSVDVLKIRREAIPKYINHKMAPTPAHTALQDISVQTANLALSGKAPNVGPSQPPSYEQAVNEKAKSYVDENVVPVTGSDAVPLPVIAAKSAGGTAKKSMKRKKTIEVEQSHTQETLDDFDLGRRNKRSKTSVVASSIHG